MCGARVVLRPVALRAQHRHTPFAANLLLQLVLLLLLLLLIASGDANENFVPAVCRVISSRCLQAAALLGLLSSVCRDCGDAAGGGDDDDADSEVVPLRRLDSLGDDSGSDWGAEDDFEEDREALGSRGDLGGRGADGARGVTAARATVVVGCVDDSEQQLQQQQQRFLLLSQTMGMIP